MADLTITAANVVRGTNADVQEGTAGETIAAGKAVYKNSTSKKWMLADSDAVTAEQRQAVGIALNAASLNQPIDVQVAGDITIGATMTAGATYFLSNTAGGICPDADVGAAEFVCLLGIASSTTVLQMNVQYPGVSR